MAQVMKQVMNFKVRKGITAAQSREHQRAWTEKGWACALAHGNYDRSRERLNFEITKGGIIQAIDKTTSMPKRMSVSLTSRGIKDPNEGLDEPRYRTVVDFIFSGTKERMREMAFGDQEVNFKPGNNPENYSMERKAEIEHWARDIYTFVADKYGEENIIGFFVHLDETTPHIHCTIMPIENGRFAFKKMFAGKDKYEFKQKTTALHNDLAKVNEPWGLSRGASITPEYRSRTTEEYHRYLDALCATKEEELSNLNKALKSLKAEISLAERRMKGLTSMVENLENAKSEKENEIARLNTQIKNSQGDNADLIARVKDLQFELSGIEEKLEDKKEKLSVADHKLRELNESMLFIESRTNELRENAIKYSREAQTGAGTFIKDAMLESMMGDYQERRALMTAEENELFKDSTLESLSEFGSNILHCATLLFLGYIDQATTFAEGHGGGGSGSGLKWGRDDDEDNRRWAHRCLMMANKMMKPSGAKSRKR